MRERRRPNLLIEGQIVIPKHLPASVYLREALESYGFKAIATSWRIAIVSSSGQESVLAWSFVRKLRTDQPELYPRIHIYVADLQIQGCENGYDYGIVKLCAHVDKRVHDMYPRKQNRRLISGEMRRLRRHLEEYCSPKACPD